MAIDLSFTKDPVWIAQREQLWEKVKDIYASELTRKQREVQKQYFFDGIRQKDSGFMVEGDFICLFPLQTKEGLAYCFKNNVDLSAKYDGGVGVLISVIYHYLGHRLEVSWQQQLTFLKLFLGESFKPDYKFPFLVGNETEFRPFPLSASRLYYDFTPKITGWLNYSSEKASKPIQVELIDYYFSLFPYVKPYELSHIIPDEPASAVEPIEAAEMRMSISRAKSIGELLKLLNTKIINENDPVIFEEKMAFVDELIRRFDSLTSPEYPQELIDNWNWVKRRSVVFRVDFETAQDLLECFTDIASQLWKHANPEYSNIKLLHKRIKSRNESAIKNITSILDRWGDEEKFEVEDYSYDEDGKFYLIFSCTEVDFMDAIRELFSLLSVKNLNVTDLTPKR